MASGRVGGVCGGGGHWNESGAEGVEWEGEGVVDAVVSA